MLQKFKITTCTIIIILALGFSYLVTSVSAENNKGYKGKAPPCPPGKVFHGGQGCIPSKGSASSENNKGYKGKAPPCPPGKVFVFPQGCQPIPDRSGKRSFLRE